MLWSAILLTLVGLLSPGDAPSRPPPTSTTSLPTSPATALALQEPPAPPESGAGTMPPPDRRGRPDPPASSALAALIAGVAVLAARARRIGPAHQTVRAALQDNLFSDVDRRDLHRIRHTLQTLSPDDANAVVAALSDREIGVWMRELDGWRGGLSSEEQLALFSDLAVRLQPRQLLRVITQGKSDEVISAVIDRAAPDARAELAMLLWQERVPADRGWERAIELVEAAPDVTEAAVARRPLSGLVEGLIGIDQPDPTVPPRIRYDAMIRFLAVAAGFEDPALKARLFVAVTERLDRHRRLRPKGDGRREDVLGGLFAVVRSDTAGVLGRLNHAADPHANAFSGWIHDMIAADRLDELDVLLSEVIGGPDRLAFFADPGDDEARPYANAANLGFYVGAYSLAVDAFVEEAEGRITLVKKLFAVLTGIVPGPDGSAVRIPLGPLVDVHAASVIDELRDGATSLKQTLWGLAKPRTPDGRLWNGAGTTQFQDAWEEVVIVR